MVTRASQREVVMRSEGERRDIVKVRDGSIIVTTAREAIAVTTVIGTTARTQSIEMIVNEGIETMAPAVTIEMTAPGVTIEMSDIGMTALRAEVVIAGIAVM